MNNPPNVVTLGCQVELELEDRSGSKERLAIVIVQDQAADYAHGFMSENTPLARAVLGEHLGAVIPYLKDDMLSITILSVSQPASLPPPDAAERRQARLNKTIREVQDTNAIVFASSFTGKWGDYDPESLPKQEQSDDESDK